jgi:hypothetical protein
MVAVAVMKAAGSEVVAAEVLVKRFSTDLYLEFLNISGRTVLHGFAHVHPLSRIPKMYGGHSLVRRL